jgi:arylsulfatase A-like enzyme
MGLPGSLTAIGPEWASVSASPFNLYKFYSSEGGLRVPLVIAGPGSRPAVSSTPRFMSPT